MAKKSQIMTIETIIVMVIFMFLLAFGAIFFGSLYKGFREEKGQESWEMTATKIATKMQYLSEVQCTKANIPTYDCMDLVKLLAFKKQYEKNYNYYSSIFQNTKISVVLVYPLPRGQNEWQIVRSNAVASTSSKNFKIPFTFYNATHDQYHFGYLHVEVLR